jgi:hypothetical protein
MISQSGLTRSSINLRGSPDPKAAVIEALGPQEHVRILEEAGTMFKVEATKWQPPVSGYVLKSAIMQSRADRPIFPKIRIGKGAQIPSVPASLPLSAFLTWLDSGQESPWLPADYLASIRSGQQSSVGGLVRRAIANYRSEWDAWVAEIQSQGRQASATMDEWLVILAGGRPMWSFRTERIFSQPSQSSAAPAWVTPKDVVYWTGHVRVNNQEQKYRTWYEVELTKLDRECKGWYKANLLEEFIVPTEDTDLTIPGNKDRVFDLSRPVMRLPADPEIALARKAGRAAAQYIDINGALGWAQINHNLCGEFCVAALAASDVIPALKQWLASYPNARDILAKDAGTSLADLESMLGVFQKKYEFFRAEASVAPMTPGYLSKMLDTGRLAIVGVGITNTGVLKWNSGIRHWVVIEDMVRVGNSGWVRLYNPFPNLEEVYPFDVVFDPISRSGIGLWVGPTHS